ncbi:MAG: hypothetical protein ACP5LI_08030 [Hydrogenobaculum sp.]
MRKFGGLTQKELSNLMKSVNAYMKSGMSRSEATQKAWSDINVKRDDKHEKIKKSK